MPLLSGSASPATVAIPQYDTFWQHLIETIPLVSHGLDYNSCILEELRSFLEVRTGKPARFYMAKRRLYETLQHFDTNSRFYHFIDLPVELRNTIYYDVLTLRPKARERVGGTCWPQILAVSKKVYEEAIGIFCDANDITIELESSLIENPDVTEFESDSSLQQSGIAIRIQ
jgi:hypothetical protein